MKVIPLTEEQSAEFLKLRGEVLALRQEQAVASNHEKKLQKQMQDMASAIGKDAALSEDGKYLVVWE